MRSKTLDDGRLPGRTNFRVRWEGQSCDNHSSDTCRCTLEVSFPHVNPPLVFSSPRIRDGKVLTLQEQYFWLVLESARFELVMQPGYETRISMCTDQMVVQRNTLDLAAQFYQRPHNQLVKAPFRSPNLPIAHIVDWDTRLHSILCGMDAIYLKAAGIRYPRRVPQDADFGPGTNPSSTEVWLNQHMFQRIVFGTYGGHRAVVNTMGNVSAHKTISLFSEFSRNDTESRFEFDHIRSLLPKAMKLLDRTLGVDHLFGKIKFTYHPTMLYSYVSNMQSSAGIRPHDNYVEPIGSEEVHVLYGGKKFHQFPYFAARFHLWMCELFHSPSIADHYRYELDTYCVIRMKDEFKYCWPPEPAECEKLINKCREFFIPNMIQQFLSRVCMVPRQALERGDVIKIGHRWTYGEAQRLAHRMKAFSRDCVWHTGDFEKLDKSIRDWMLSLYVMSGKRYFYTETKQDEEFMRRCFVMLAEKINVKLVNHIQGFWTLVKGIMYSGGYETSHGDSWIVLLVWCLYLVDMVVSQPEGPQIARMIAQELIRIIVYGDDHVWVTPRAVSHILNEQSWAVWLKRYTGMVIRDAATVQNFFSVVDSAGEIKDAGVVFLKRYFVVQRPYGEGYPSVLPFKPTHDSILKLVCNKDNDPRTYPLQAIGQAYDTLGTNPVAYMMIKHFYDEWMKKLDMTPYSFRSVVRQMHKTQSNRLTKKIGFDILKTMPVFPTLDSLMQQHQIDGEKGSNVIPLSTVQQFYLGDFAAMGELVAY